MITKSRYLFSLICICVCATLMSQGIDCQSINTTLPLVIITTDQNVDIVDDPKVSAHMGIVFNGDNLPNNCQDTFNIYDGRIAIEIRGTSSQEYDKKGYGFETQKEDGTNNNVALLGMPKENDWVLHGPYADKSLLRNVVTYHMGNLTGRYTPRTRFCELFVNGKYLGIYILTEKIKQDKNRVDIANLRPTENAGDSLTGGYIIKVDRNEQNIPDIGWESTFPDYKFMAYVEPKAKDITNQQKIYIKNYMYLFELAMSQDNIESSYTDFIDVNSWVDYFLVTEIGKHIDAFKLSFYMYKDKDSKGGKLHLGPLWDFNFGYGNFDFACSPDPDGWSYEFPDCGSWHPFWARKIFDIPNLQHLTSCRWEALRQGPFRTDSLMQFIDHQVNELGPAIDRNFERWPILGEYVWANDFIGETYDEELDFFKQWLTNRLQWMDDNMIGDCSDYISSTKTTTHNRLLLYPNPAHESISIQNMETIDIQSEITIYDVNGNQIKSISPKGKEAKISVSDMDHGFYILSIMDKQQVKHWGAFLKI